MRAFSLGSDAQHKKILVKIKEEVMDQITYMSPSRTRRPPQRLFERTYRLITSFWMSFFFFPKCTSANVPGFGPKPAKQMM